MIKNKFYLLDKHKNVIAEGNSIDEIFEGWQSHIRINEELHREEFQKDKENFFNNEIRNSYTLHEKKKREKMRY